MLGQIFCVPNSNNSKKKDGSVKLALESRELNKQVHKNKYQMPNIEELMDTVGRRLAKKNQETYISPRWI